jgi:hypothetical protein
MKKYAWVWFVGTVLFLSVVSSVGSIAVVPNAYAGDDKVVTLNMSVDAGSEAVCTSAPLALKQYAVQPTVDTYVNVSPTGDGGVGVVDSDAVLVGANKLYDIWPTSDRKYICCKPAANGAASKCKIKLPRQH